MKRTTCWNASAELKCAEVESQLTDGFEGVNFDSEPFTLKQRFMRKDKYKNRDDWGPSRHQPKNEYQYKTLISDFPIAYKLVSYSDVKQENEKATKSVYPDKRPAWFFEKDDRHYKVNAESYAKAKNRATEKTNSKTDEKGYFYLCKSQPSNWKDAFDGSDAKCFTGPITVKGLYNYAQDEDGSYYDAFFKSFLQTNIGDFPSFYRSYKAKEFRDGVFTYGDSKLCQFAIASLIIQIAGVIFWACGKFLGGSD